MLGQRGSSFAGLNNDLFHQGNFLHPQEPKQVYSQVEPEAQPERFVHLDFQYFLLQPLYGPLLQENTQAV
ncbi:MAG: hypothetical protein U1F76_14410 [Candidatus Competibacteraceae bacterium]